MIRPLAAFSSGVDLSEFPLGARTVEKIPITCLETRRLCWDELEEEYLQTPLSITVTQQTEPGGAGAIVLDTQIRYRAYLPSSGAVHSRISAEVLALLLGDFMSRSAHLTATEDMRVQMEESFLSVASKEMFRTPEIKGIKDISTTGSSVPLGTPGDVQPTRYIRVTFEPTLSLGESELLKEKIRANDPHFVPPTL